jgi:HSP20 family protein
MFKLTPFNTQPSKNDNFVDFYNVIDDFFNAPFRSIRHDSFKLDVREEEKAYLIEADLPGIRKEEVKVSYDDQTLTINVERNEEKEEKKEQYLHRERKICSMKRALHLPDIDPSKVKASLSEGVLKVVAEKQEVQEHGYVIDVE